MGSGDDLLAADEATCEGDDSGCDWAAGGPFLPGLVLRGLGWGFVLPLSMKKMVYMCIFISKRVQFEPHLCIHTYMYSTLHS